MIQKIIPLKLAYFIATGGHSGYFPKIPGTAGTFVGLLIAFFAIPFGGKPLLGVLFFLSVVLGLACSYVVLKQEQLKNADEVDPQIVVIDEISGIWLTLLLLPRLDGLVFFGLAFLAFRFFDMTKLFPTCWVERKFKGAFGIMADDWVAGLLAAILVTLITPFI